MAGKSKVAKRFNFKNPLELGSDSTGITKSLADSAVNDVLKGGASDFLSLLGIDTPSKGSQPTEIFNSKDNSEKKAQKPEARVEAAIDYHRDIVRSSERVSGRELQSRQSQIQQLRLEIQSLVSSTKMLEMQFAQVTTEQSIASVGTYHENFLEFMIKHIRAARAQVEDSGAWMGAQKGKAGKKGYWGMFKQHGTSFAMSNERGVATQVG